MSPCSLTLLYHRPNSIQSHTQIRKHLRRHSVILTKQTQQNMLGPDMIVLKRPSLLGRILNNIHRSRRRSHRNIRRRISPALQLKQLLHLPDHLKRINATLTKNIPPFAAALLYQPKKNMLSPDTLMAKPLRQLIRKRHNPAPTLGKSLKHSQPQILTHKALSTGTAKTPSQIPLLHNVTNRHYITPQNTV